MDANIAMKLVTTNRLKGDLEKIYG